MKFFSDNKYIFPTMALMALALSSILCSTTVTAMKMPNMLMGNTLESFLSDLVSLGDITVEQKSSILTISDFASSNSNVFSQADDSENEGYRTEAFASEPSKQELRAFLYTEVSAGVMELETAEIISSTLSLGALYPDENSEGLAFLQQPPAVASYSGEGNVIRVGRWNGLVSTSTSFYNGIWGYAVGDREYALQCHGQGFNIIDITDPTSPFRVQFVPMEGGGYWRDAATHHDAVTGKSYAYVGAQGNQGGGTNPNLFVFDLSNLSGDINAPNGVDSNPCVYLNLGMTGLTHTINVARGLLFLHTAYSSNGCRVYDLTTNPMNPKYLFNTSGSGRDCHDSGVIENVNGRDLWVVSDGGGRRQRIWDITNVGASWPTGALPPLVGQTNQISGIYAHSNWVSDDKRYLFSWDENNVIDISVHDITNPAAPIEINLFQYSENSQYNAIPHNGEVRAKYLYVAYYEAGLRVFDISNPYAPLEVGKAETYRDADGDGDYTRGISGSYDGAWNTYPFLPSGNILVSDMYGGLFIVRADPPYPTPDAPTANGPTRWIRQCHLKLECSRQCSRIFR